MSGKSVNGRFSEIIAIALTVGGIVAATTWPFFHESGSVGDRIPSGAQVITLTGVASTGTWTEEVVSGANYWQGDFRPARPVLKVGQPVLLRLKSADVMHAFYAPELNAGPVEVYPGHVEEILVTPRHEGVFGYYCPTMCGDPHFGMRGVIIVQEEDGANAGASGPWPDEASKRFGRYWLEPPPPQNADLVTKGGWLFRQKGCQTCHGMAGRGGVKNYNYIKDTVPELATLRKRMFLFKDAHVEEILRHLEEETPLETLEEDPPFRRFGAFLAQYDSVREVIRKGNPAGRKDPEGPLPPLEMPAWGYRLSERDIDTVIAYLLSLNSTEQ
jgi:mono/diheme cytochrome c family protein